MQESRFLTVSLFFHLALIILFGGTVLFKAAQKESIFVTEEGFLAPGEELEQADSTDAQTEFTEPEVSGGAQATENPVSEQTLSMLTASHLSSPSVSVPISQGQTFGRTYAAASSSGTGGLTGAKASGTMSGALKTVRFFGIESKAQRVGFYLDFSGSMAGERRVKMLEEMAKTLKDLPDGMEVMIINWAGPAWNLDQRPADVKGYWKKAGTFDWSITEAEQIKAPEFFKLSSGTRKKILELLEKAAALPGGTDWKSPFVLAAKSTQAADAIYFMSDGQGASEAMLRGVHDALKRTKPSNPVINVVGLNPKPEWEEGLQKLAAKSGGKYNEIP